LLVAKPCGCLQSGCREIEDSAENDYDQICSVHFPSNFRKKEFWKIEKMSILIINYEKKLEKSYEIKENEPNGIL